MDIATIESLEQSLLKEVKILHEAKAILMKYQDIGAGGKKSIVNYEPVPKLSIEDKIMEVFKREQRFLFKQEIIDLLMLFDSGLQKTKLQTNVINYLRKLKAAELLQYVKVNNQNTLFAWGSPAWISDQGTINEAFKFNEGYATKK